MRRLRKLRREGLVGSRLLTRTPGGPGQPTRGEGGTRERTTPGSGSEQNRGRSNDESERNRPEGGRQSDADEEI